MREIYVFFCLILHNLVCFDGLLERLLLKILDIHFEARNLLFKLDNFIGLHLQFNLWICDTFIHGLDLALKLLYL